jgi:hypothetical protein
MKIPSSIAILPVLALCAAPALAQNGSDDCANATPITGLGTWPFDNTGFTIDGPADCNNQPVRRDLWYLWTATQTSSHEISTCAGTSLSTRIVIYDGFDCATFPQVACGAATCGQQTILTFNAVQGQQYLIRLGSRQAGDSGSGTFDITPLSGVIQNPNNGHYYYVDDRTVNYPTAEALAQTLSWNGLTGHLVSITDQAEMDWIQANMPYDRTWIGLFQNTASPSYSEPAGGWEWVTGEPFVYNNWHAGEPNDNPAGENAGEMLNGWGGEWNDLTNGDVATTTSFIVEFDGLGGGGGPDLFCDPANPNSTGQSVTLANSGVSGPGVYHLEAEGGPVDQFGAFVVAATPNTAGVQVSQGLLCLAPPLGRYTPAAGATLNSVGKFNAGGVFESLFGNSTVGTGFDVPATLPAPPGGTIVAGSTWHFQLWYRDLGGVSNFSNGITVTF